jgi:hypothetical protein
VSTPGPGPAAAYPARAGLRAGLRPEDRRHTPSARPGPAEGPFITGPGGTEAGHHEHDLLSVTTIAPADIVVSFNSSGRPRTSWPPARAGPARRARSLAGRPVSHFFSFPARLVARAGLISSPGRSRPVGDNGSVLLPCRFR